MKVTLSELQKRFLDQADARDARLGSIDQDIQKAQSAEFEKHLKRMMAVGDVFGDYETTGVNDKNEIHPNMKNYDHSSEKTRMEGTAKGSSHTIEDYIYRPVERNGKIEMEASRKGRGAKIPPSTYI